MVICTDRIGGGGCHCHGACIPVVMLKNTGWCGSKASGLQVAKGQVQGGPHIGTVPTVCSTEPEHVEVLKDLGWSSQPRAECLTTKTKKLKANYSSLDRHNQLPGSRAWKNNRTWNLWWTHQKGRSLTCNVPPAERISISLWMREQKLSSPKMKCICIRIWTAHSLTLWLCQWNKEMSVVILTIWIHVSPAPCGVFL